MRVADGERTEVEQAIRRLDPWFQNLHLPGGIQTAPNHPLGDFPSYKWRRLAPHLPADLRGWRALEVGSNAGFYSFELARRGAQVVGIDIDPHYLAQARWAATQYGLEDRIDWRRMQVYDLAHTAETFDLVLFMGVFYHLRYPMLGLDIVAQKARRLLVFQSLCIPGEEIFTATDGLDIDNREAMREPGWPKLAFIEHTLAGDPTNWWAPNRAAVEALLRSSGMRVIERLRHELFVCAPDPAQPSSASTWNAAELLAATGRPWQTSSEEQS